MGWRLLKYFGGKPLVNQLIDPVSRNSTTKHILRWLIFLINLWNAATPKLLKLVYRFDISLVILTKKHLNWIFGSKLLQCKVRFRRGKKGILTGDRDSRVLVCHQRGYPVKVNDLLHHCFRTALAKWGLSLNKQEPGWTWYIGHPIEFSIRIIILDHFGPILDNFGPFRTILNQTKVFW